MSKQQLRTKVRKDLEYYESMSLVGAVWSCFKGVAQMLAMVKDFLFVVASTEKIVYSEKYYAQRLTDAEEDANSTAPNKRKPNFFDED